MKRVDARAIATNPLEVVLGDKQIQQLVRLASRFAGAPLDFTPAEIGELARTAGSEEAFLEVTGVIAGFSFITRMADALGVDPQVPAWLTEYPPMGCLTSQLMPLVVRCAVDLKPRCFPKERAEGDRRVLEELLRHLELGPLPGFFERLTRTPHLLLSERVFFEAINDAHGPDPGRFMAAGRVVLEDVSRSTLLSRIDDWFDRRGAGPREQSLRTAVAQGNTTDGLVSEMLDFAKAMTNRACIIVCERVQKPRMSHPADKPTTEGLTPERVQNLRSCNLTDEEILDWAFAVALWNAIGRTERLLECEL